MVPYGWLWYPMVGALWLVLIVPCGAIFLAPVGALRLAPNGLHHKACTSAMVEPSVWGPHAGFLVFSQRHFLSVFGCVYEAFSILQVFCRCSCLGSTLDLLACFVSVFNAVALRFLLSHDRLSFQSCVDSYVSPHFGIRFSSRLGDRRESSLSASECCSSPA